MSWKDNDGVEEPPFIKLYLEDLGKLSNLTSVQRLVFDMLMKYASYGNEVIISKRLKEIILKSTGIAEGSFKNALSVLVKKNLICKGNKRSIYYINPDLAYKGKVIDRAKVIILYNELGERKIKLEVYEGN